MGQSASALTMSTFSEINIALPYFVAALRTLLWCNFNDSCSIFMTLQGSNEEKIWTADNKIEIYRSVDWGQLPYMIVSHVFMEGPTRIDLYFYVLPLGLLLNQVAWLVFIDWKIHEKYCHYWRDFKWAVLPAVFIVLLMLGIERGGAWWNKGREL